MAQGALTIAFASWRSSISRNRVHHKAIKRVTFTTIRNFFHTWHATHKDNVLVRHVCQRIMTRSSTCARFTSFQQWVSHMTTVKIQRKITRRYRLRLVAAVLRAWSKRNEALRSSYALAGAKSARKLSSQPDVIACTAIAVWKRMCKIARICRAICRKFDRRTLTSWRNVVVLRRKTQKRVRTHARMGLCVRIVRSWRGLVSRQNKRRGVLSRFGGLQVLMCTRDALDMWIRCAHAKKRCRHMVLTMRRKACNARIKALFTAWAGSFVHRTHASSQSLSLSRRVIVRASRDLVRLCVALWRARVTVCFLFVLVHVCMYAFVYRICKVVYVCIHKFV
jgi:hypothetical protein